MNKIKTVKIKNLDGSISEESYNLSVDAKEVDMSNGRDLQETIGTINIDENGNISEQLKNLDDNKIDKIYIVDNLESTETNKALSANQGRELKEITESLNNDTKKKAYFFNTVNDMKIANLKVGDYVCTKGYYEANDGGAANYSIVNDNTLIDDGGSVHILNNSLKAVLIVDKTTNVKTFGAYGDDTHNDSQALLTMLSKLNYIYLIKGTYKISETITLHTNQTLYGEDKKNCRIHYTGTQNCITNEDISTSNGISIHDLSIIGTNRQGNGIYLIRTIKSGDCWHRLKNLNISLFDYGLYLSKNLNETLLDDIVATSNNYGVYIADVNDFYLSNIVTAVNRKNGITLLRSTEARLINIKSWYNGIDGSSYYNLALNNCVAIMATNLGCQESYYTNMQITYSKDITIKNCYLSLPNLTNSANVYQVKYDGNIRCNLECQTANKKSDGEYINKIIDFSNDNENCIISIQCEDDFPINMKETVENSAIYKAIELKNEINISNIKYKYNKGRNFALNGNLSNKNTTDMIYNGNDKLSWNNGLLRFTAGEATAYVNFKTAQIPIIDDYVEYIKIKKVSGSGRVILGYVAYVDIKADDEAGTEYLISRHTVPSNINARTNFSISGVAGLVFDIVEIGYCPGNSAILNNPLSENAVIS